MSNTKVDVLLLEHIKHPQFHEDSTLYDMLGAKPNWPVWRIQAQYELNRSRLHPDRHMFASEEQQARLAENYQQMSKAAAILTDPILREVYDRYELQVTAAELGLQVEKELSNLMTMIVDGLIERPDVDMDGILHIATDVINANGRNIMHEQQKAENAAKEHLLKCVQFLRTAPERSVLYRSLLAKKVKLDRQIREACLNRLLATIVLRRIEEETKLWRKRHTELERQRRKAKVSKETNLIVGDAVKTFYGNLNSRSWR